MPGSNRPSRSPNRPYASVFFHLLVNQALATRRSRTSEDNVRLGKLPGTLRWPVLPSPSKALLERGRFQLMRYQEFHRRCLASRCTLGMHPDACDVTMEGSRLALLDAPISDDLCFACASWQLCCTVREDDPVHHRYALCVVSMQEGWFFQADHLSPRICGLGRRKADVELQAAHTGLGWDYNTNAHLFVLPVTLAPSQQPLPVIAIQTVHRTGMSVLLPVQGQA